ncbi:non-ribosomal peptide synthase/polyketide synthase [Streptomyces sp. NPDC051183]|uniref:non-ribosomal peptide synthase/polyketide synthase n=1 Tax=Streptomyces sp. NPDC051183 TaxID=3155165 RepID=UPI0034444C2B
MTTSAERTQTPDQLRAELLRRLTAGRAGAAGHQEIPRVDRGLPLPLSAGQQQMWFLNRLEPESPEYLVPLAIRLTGDLDESALRTAVDRVVARHEVLRTRYDLFGDEPAQLVDEPGPVPFLVEDLAALPAADRESVARQLTAEYAQQAFDLAGEWPLRVRLIRLSATEHVLVLVFHHIACDAWSTQIFAQDLSAYYRGSRPASELTVQYADFAAWQQKNTEGPALDQHLAYWRDRLDGVAPLDLPADRPRPAVRSSAGAAVALDLPAQLAASLRGLATEHRTTLFTVLLTAYQTLLAKYTGTSDIAVGTVVSGRTRPELQQLIGYGINSLVLRGSWDGDPRFTRLLEQSRVDVLDAFDHQDMPFARLVDAIQPERDLSRTPLFQAAFTLHESRTAAYDLPGITVEPFETPADTARFDLQLLVEEVPDGTLRGRFEYATALFDAATAQRLADHFGRLLHSIAADPAARLSALDVLAPAERALVIQPAPEETPDPRFVHEVFEAQVAATPDAVAVSADGQELTYAELNARANRIAHHLRTLGAGPDTLVGICLERGPELMPALLGVLKSGAGYLPLDPANPADRLAYVLKDAGALAVLTETRHAPMIEEIHEGPLVVLDRETGSQHWQSLPTANPSLAGHPDQLIYVIYTSGSTGKPKGVCLSHRNILRLLTTAYRHYGFSTEDVWPLFHSYAFDVSVWEMWGALLHGGKLVVVPAAVTRSPDEFLDLLVDQQVTVLNQTPSAFRSLVVAAAEGDPRIDRLALRAVVFAGEKLTVPDLKPWTDRRGLAAPALLNMYGITETTVHTTFYEVTEADLAPDASNPIGVPLDDLRVHLLDAWGEPVPVGVFGEIHVAGPGVARGYLGRPALTAERFVPDPWGPAGSRLYKSGDIARRRPDGSLEFLGRADGQIKIRGYRVELGEIQAALAALPGIHDAVVVLREDTPGAKEIVAYLITAGGAAHDPADLREALARDLAPYMIPAAFVTLERLPLTTNGKLDKRALPAPGSDARRATGTRTAPRTPAEQRIADVWEEVLGLDALGVDDSFFELGGDSIRAVALVGSLRAAGFDVTVRDVFDRRTVARLAELVTGRTAPAELPEPVRPFQLIRPGDRDRLPAGLTDAYPLSQVQTGMVLEMALPGSANNYHNVTSFRIRDERPFHHAALVEAARIVTARHEVLRTSIDLDGYSVPMQLVHAEAEMAVGSQSLRGLDEDEIRAAILDHTARERADVFDLAVPALMRLYAHDTGTGGWWLSVTECHPVLEGWSHHSLLMEILDLYAALRDGRPVREPEPTAIRFADFIAEEARALEDETHHAYWSRITDEYAPIAAPAGWGEAPGSPRAIHVIEVPVEDLYDRLRTLATRSRASFKSVMLAAHLKVMSQLTEQTRFTAGLVCDSRPELLDADRVYGMYLNTLPFAHDAGAAATWSELVAQVFAAEVELWPHRRFPLPAVQRLAGGRQLIEVYFNYQDFHQVDLDRVDYLASIDDSPTEFPLTVSSRAGHIIVTANGRALSRDNAERVAAMYRRVLVAMAADPEGDARAVLLPADERARVLEEWNDSSTAASAGTVPELFAARVAASADAVAVTSGGVSLSYAELDARSEALAHRLVAEGVRPGDVVGVLLERGVELLVALLAVQRAGGAYLPMDASHPASRLAGIVADAAPVALIAQPSLAATADEIHPGGWLPVDGAPVDAVGALPAVDAAAVAYVLYTSGSTGKPKGVQVTHGALGNLLVGIRRVLGEARAEESWLASTSVSFDISGLELYLPLTGGHRVVIAEAGDDLTELVAAERVTHVQATPSGWKLLREAGFSDRAVTALVGGEALPVELARELRGHVARLVNVYGPTETTIWSATWEVPAEAAAISIGSPIDNTQLYVVDALMQPVPLGVVGELCIAGDGVAQGYLGRPDLTAERFAPDPFGPAGTRLYKTGDLARRLFDGSLEFLGRTDHQVKIRGYRIELGEIESRLLAHPQVRDAAVIARTEESGDTWLVGYVIPAEGAIDQAAVRGFLREELPDYMVPGAFVELDAWPLNTAGKLDRKALPAPTEFAAAAEYVAPRTETEARLAEAWATALGHEQVSVEDSFFDLGGDSIRAIGLASEVRAAGFQVSVPDIFTHNSVAALARHLDGREAPAVTAAEYVRPYALLSDADRAALPAGVTDAYPVSQVQLGMLVEMDLDDEQAAYHNVDGFEVQDDRPFDAAALQRAAEEVIARHEVLRTGFDLTSYSTPLQLVRASAPTTVAVADLSLLDPRARERAVIAHEQAERQAVFAVAEPPLVRFSAQVLTTGSWHLTLTYAHPVLEGWSYHALLGELLAVYREIRDTGAATAPAATPARYADFIAGELDSLADDADRAYWQSVVDGNAALELPAGWGGEPGVRRAPVAFGDLEPRLRELAAATGTSFKSVLLAAHLAVMSRLTPEQSFHSGLVADARPELPGSERVLGMHLNTLPFAHDRSAATWSELVAQVFAAEIGAWSHRRHPLPAIQRLAGGRQLLNVYFNYQDYGRVTDGSLEHAGASAQLADPQEGPTEFPLTVATRKGHLVLTAHGAVLSQENTDRIAAMYRLALEAMAADPEGDAQAPLLPEGERARVLAEGNDTATAATAGTVTALFAARVLDTPEARAVTSGGRSLSYGELDARSNRFARHLLAMGVRPGDVVGVLLERGVELLVALLAVQKAGAAYLPLDASHPASRLGGIVADARPSVLVTQDALGPVADEIHSGEWLLVDGTDAAVTAELDSDPLDIAVDPAAVAYVLYTSGSTGKPKGVQVTHGALGNLLVGIRRVLGAGWGESWLASTSVSFDISGLELYLPLIGGHRVVIAEAGDDLAELVREQEVTHVQATPSGWKLLLESGFADGGVTALVGGEALPVELARELRARVGRLVNVYGPTETTIWSSAWEVPEGAEAVSIGAPIDNTQFYVVDALMQPVPLGVVGELCIAGDGVAQGYLGRPDLTAERFAPDPFGPAGTRLYKTGDLARRLFDGSLEFLGRTDHQVKIRGYRIELGEIESRLLAHPQVRDAAVIARTEESGDTWLVGYVIPAEGAIDQAAVRGFLREELPDYMVPGAFVELDAWPLNTAGKLDRKALPAPTRGAESTYIAPRTDAEASIAHAWESALGLERVSVEDSFFDLGGDSIRAVSVVGALKALGHRLSVRTIFTYQTVAELADHLAAQAQQEDTVSPTNISTRTAGAADAAEALAGALAAAGIDLAADGLSDQTSVADLLALLRTQAAPTAAEPQPAPGEGGLAPFALLTDEDRERIPEGLADAYPLSQVQTGMAVETLVEDGGDDYHRVTSFRVRDGHAFSRTALEAAARTVAARHEVLRTSIDLTGYSVPMQLVHATAEIPLHVEDLTGIRDEESLTRAVQAHVAVEESRPFALGDHSLLRIAALVESDRAWWLSLTHSHIILEGWSHHSLLMEILDVYRTVREGGDPDAGREPVPARYADFIAGELESLADEGDREYWAHTVDAYPALSLPAGWGEPTAEDGRGYRLPVAYSDLEPGLKKLAERARVSAKSVLIAAHLKVMSQLTEESRFSAGLVTDARPELLGAERVCGMHLNTVPFAHEAGLATTWAGLVRQVFDREMELFDHRRYPLPAIQRLAEPGQSVVEVLFTYQNYHQVDTELIDVEANLGDATSQFPLAVTTLAGHLVLTANERDLARPQAQRVADMYRLVLEAMAADPEGDARAVLLPADEEALVVTGWNDTATETPAPTVPELFAARVAASADAVAVTSGGVSLSYAEVDARSEALAHRLVAEGVRPGDVVGVLLERGVELLVALLAVQKSGGAYLPMDAAHPAARLAGIVTDAAPAVLVTQDSLAAVAAEIHSGTRISVSDTADAPGRLPAIDRDAVAYVLYTSGSTGKPKGVQVTHGALGNLLVGIRRVLGEARAEESWLASTSVSFDISGLELYLPLTGGHRVVIAEAGDDLTELVAAERVTHVQATPSGWKLLREAGFSDRAVTALVGGEALPVELARELRGHVARLVNVYGPTETTIWSATWEVPAEAAAISIGSPIDNTQLYVVDALMQPVPLGVVGELCIAGDGVAQGYLGRPDLTAERFAPDPFGPAGTRLYKTGDLARRLFDGSLEFLGRTDHQVKIRGYRIELGEIESRLLAHPQVRDAAVIARTEESGDTWLVGYVIPAEGAIDQAAVRGFLREELPDYMVPGAFVELEAWPLNTAGKLDRKALPAPTEFAAAAEYVAPRTETEARLAEAWATALGHEQVSVEDSFFDLGGDSIRAIVLVGAIRSAGFQVAVQDVFEHRTIAALARHLGGPADSGEAPGPVEEVYVQPYALLSDADRAALPAGVTDAYPVSQVQLGMLVEMTLDEDGAAYHNVDAFRVRDGRPFDAAALQRAAEELVLRHEVLRTGFDLTGYGTPLQLVHADVPVEVPVTDLSALSAEAFGPALRAVNAEESARPFDTARPPLLRVRAVLEDDTSWWLVLTHAHPILEGWSYHSLMSELLVCYREFADQGFFTPTDRPASRYADFIAAELASLADPVEEEYWRTAVAEHAVLELPAAWGDPQGAEGEAEGDRPYDTVQVNVPTYDLMPRLRELATTSGTSLKSVFLAAHLKVLSQVTEEASFHTGLAIDARPETAGADRVAGMHLNTVPFAHLRTAGTWRELVRQVFDRELALWPHRRHPLPAIQRAAGGRRLLNSVFNYLDFHQVDAELVDEEASTGIGSTEFPLAVISRGGWLGLRSDTRHLTPAQAEGLGEMYRQVLRAMAADAEGDARATFLPAADRALVLRAPASIATAPVTTTLHSLFEEQAAERPDAGAVTAAGTTLSYGELNARANRIAHRLRALGVGAEDIVGLCVARGPELVPALLGILKAGAAYLPMDPAQPAARLAFMAEDQGLKVVLTESAHQQAAVAAHSGSVLVLDAADTTADLAALPDTDPAPVAESGNLAYVIYTSGSTGVPKGVGVTHANAVRLMLATEERFPLDDRHVWPLIHSYAFDVSVFELWAALLYGSRLVVVDADTARNPDELLDLLVAEKMTVLLNSPSAFRGLAAAVQQGDPRTEELNLRAMFFGGEKHDGAALAPWTDRFGLDAPQLVELYGPTEATVQVTHHRITEADLASEHGIPLGRPLADTRILVLDEDARPVPVGVPGELAIGGPALSRGYLGRPALTADRFVPDPYGEPGGRLYRTGDLARLRPDGGLEFLGRTDNQIKIRGYRVELGEIQSVLVAHPAVHQAVVVTDESAPGDPRIAAYAVPADPEASLPSPAELAEYCRERLPEYMVPGAFTALAAIPLISNTKVDRKALPAPDWAALAADQPYVAPRTGDEERIAAVWAEVLGLPRVGAEDAFFDIGGDSIRAVSLVGALRAAGYALSVRDVFDARTVAGLAALAAAGAGRGTDGHRAVEPFALVPAADLAALPAGLTDAYPVSQGQLGILVEMLAEPAGHKYLNVNAFRIRDDRPFDAAALGKAVAILAGRHEVLRTGFDLTGHSVPLQLVHTDVTLPVAVRSLAGLDAEGVDAAVGRYLAEQRATPFDLAVPSLLRVSALVEDASADGQVWWLGLAECHAITEGWSHHSMLMELLGLYRQLRDGREPEGWTAPEVRYADFVAGELESLASAEDEAYWRRITARYEPFALPEGWGDADSTPEPFLVRVPFADVEPGLRELARRSRASMKSVLHAVHLAVLARLTDQQEFSAGLATDARPEALGAERVLGMHLNTVPFAHDSSARTWRELVAGVYEREAAIWPHRRHPLPAIQRLAGGRRLVDVAFNYQDYKQLDTDLIDIGSSAGAAATEFSLIVTTLNGHLSLATHTGVLRREEAERIASMYRGVVLAMAADPEGEALAPLPDGERELLAAWGAKDVRDCASTVTSLFAARVAEAPDSVAVSAGDLALSYRELDGRAARLAARLRSAGVGRGSVVAVGLDRSAELPVALLGVLKAGAAYLPLDPAYPADRLAFMLADSGAAALLTAERLAGSLPDWDGPALLVDAAAADEDGPLAPALEQHPDELAYVMYTSGSTGTPKATEVTHRGVVRTATDDALTRVGPEDVVSHVASVSFDGATWELWSALLGGARLEVLDRDTVLDTQALAAAVESRGITAMILTTSLFNHVARTIPGTLAGVRTVIFGGETADASTVRDLVRSGGPRHLVHGYGPTENTTFSTVHEVTDVPDGATSVPIGGPVAGSRLHVLDAEQRPVPRGVTGELYVGGPGLARGYRGQPALTAARFVPDPYAGPGALMYRTGDLVRWQADGTIDFVGRADHQIKLRGYRIEPGEIESALQTHPALDHAAVVLREDNPGEKRLVAYVVPVPGAEEVPLPADLQGHLAESLPDYMVPAAFVVLDRMPLTANGKLDTRALPVPGTDALAAARGGAAPATEDEIRIAAVWTEVLGVDGISVTDSFFDLGGDSIRAVTLVGALKTAGYSVTVSEVFEHRTVGKLAVAVAGREVSETRYVQPFELIGEADRALVPAGVTDVYPLSQLQTGMLVELLAYDGPAANNYHNTTSFDIRDGIPFDADAMREAARRVTARHEALRTCIDLDTYSVPMQLVHAEAEMPVTVHDLTGLDDDGWRTRVLEISNGEQERLFDMAKPPFVRLNFAVGDTGWRMFLSLNHTILEGWGHYSLWMELLTTYAALRDGEEPAPAALPPLRFADFIAGEHESLASAEERAYWRGIVTDHAQFTLPAAWRQPEESGKAFSVTVSLRDIQPRIKAVASAADVPVKSVLLAAHLKVMAQLTEERDFYTGLVCDTRPELPGADLVYGMYLNTLPIHHKGGAATWRELLTQVFAQETELWPNRRFPLPEVQREAGGRRIIDVFFNYLDFRQIDTDLMDLGSSLREGGTEFDLAVTTMAGELGLLTDTRVMSREQARRLGRMYRLVLEAIIADLDGDATAVLLPEEERELLLGEWAGPAAAAYDTTPVHRRFAARAAENPAATAVVTAGAALSYGELDARANRFAHHLVELGVGRGEFVAILLERGPDMLVAVLGALKAGAAYLPLDPETPAERLTYQLADSEAPVLVTQESLLAAVPADSSARLVVLEREAGPIAARPQHDPAVAVDADDLVYTIYTSGSTGRPKGVLITHGGLANYLGWALEYYGMDGANGAPMFGSIAFDLAVPSFLLPLISGRDVTMVPGDRGQEALPDLLRAGGDYSILKITPAHLDLVTAALGEDTVLDSVRTFVVGGEEMKPEMVAGWRRTAPRARIVNEYGPTETVVGCVVHTVASDEGTATDTAADGVPVPIGRPITNTEVYVLDAGMRPVPAGVVGELYLGGAGVARGYGGRPSLTAEKFVPHPFTDRPGARLYRTGDLARFRRDGSLDFLGRGDDQVKIRGYRVELGEIEATLLLAPGVKDAVVLARQDRPGERRLVAYVVPADGASPTPAELAAELRRTLPAYMVPAVFIALDALPLAVSGKVDRKALPAPGQDRMPDTGRPPYVAPGTATEELLARIWGEALGIDKVGAHDSFFDLGGDSIMVLPLISAARKAGLAISLRTLYESETLAELAAAVAPRAAAPRTVRGIPAPAEAMIEHQVPGVSVAVIRDGELAEVRGFGVTSAGGGARVTPDTLFPAASMSKFVSALGVLRLAKDGLIDLDGDVSRHLTSWQVPGGAVVTADQLLRFTAGITHPETALENHFYGRGEPRPTAAEILHGRAPAKTPPVVLEGVPGRVFMKNNVSYTVLQQLVEDVTGTPFPQYMREKVFAPLGMTASFYEPELPPAAAAVAVGHGEDGAPLAEGSMAHPDTAAAGLWTTAGDLARVLLEIRRAHRGEASEVLDPALAGRMLTVVEPGRFYGTGSIVDTTGGDLEYGHTGRTSGFHALALSRLGSGTGVVVLTNADSGRAVLKQVLASVRDEDEAWAGQGEMTRLWEQGRINPDAQD